MEDPASFENFNDLAFPPDVSAWPLAPGWWALIAMALLMTALLSIRFYHRWRANAYRRQALRELSSTDDLSAINSILRRCALVIAPRTEIASKTGDAWVSWLESMSDQKTSEEERALLSSGPYRSSTSTGSIGLIKRFAQNWVRDHRNPEGQTS